MRPIVFEKIPEFFLVILPAITTTLHYVLVSFVIGLLFGILLALLKISKFKVLRAAAYGYTTIMRCTPPVVLLFLIYYGLPSLLKTLTGVVLNSDDKIQFIIVTLAMFSAATLSEAIRSSYESIDKSQIEASVSVGMTKGQAFVHILFPQMLHSMMPNLCNTILMLLKEGTLAYIIGLFDLLGKAKYIVDFHMGAYVVESYTALILIYWPLSILIGFIAKRLEERFDYDNKTSKASKRRVTGGT